MNLQTPESDSLPQLANLTPHTCGTTWRGIPTIGPITVNGVPPGVIATAEFHFLASLSDAEPSLKLSAPSSGLVINSTTQWMLSIPEQMLPLAPGVWHWKLVTTDTAGNVRVFSKGNLLIRF